MRSEQDIRARLERQENFLARLITNRPSPETEWSRAPETEWSRAHRFPEVGTRRGVHHAMKTPQELIDTFKDYRRRRRLQKWVKAHPGVCALCGINHRPYPHPQLSQLRGKAPDIELEKE